MPTQTELESRLRTSLRSAADATQVDADWESFSDRLQESEGTLPTLQPAPTRRPMVTRPVFVLASGFAVVLVVLGLVSLLNAPGSSTQAASPATHPVDDSLRYVPTFFPEYVGDLNGWFTDGDFVDEGVVEAQPTHVFVTWANEKTVESGLVVWPTDQYDLGQEPDAEGFWVQDFEDYPWLRVRGETADGIFTVDGTGDIDRELVYDVARSIRDGQPLPDGVNELDDVTPAEEQYLDTPIERNWHLFAEGQGNHFDAVAHAAHAATEPVVQLAMFPWSCELIQLDTSAGVICDPGEWRLVWEPAPDTVIAMSTVGFSRDDAVNVANSMQLVSGTDPLVPSPYTGDR